MATGTKPRRPAGKRARPAGRRSGRATVTVEDLLKQLDRERAARKQVRKIARRQVYSHAGKSAGRAGWVGRRYIGQFYTTGLLEVAGLAVQHRGRTAGLIVLFAAVALIGTLVLARHRHWPGFVRWYVTAWIAGAAGWLVGVNFVGAGAPMPGILICAAFASAVPWWIHLYRAAHATAPPAEPAVEIDDRILQFESTAVGTYLPKGTRLHTLGPVAMDDDGDGDPDMLGFTGTIQLPAGATQTFGDIAAKQANLAATFGVSAASIVVEMTAEQIPDRARLTVLTRRNPAHEINEFDRTWIILKDGCFPYGIYPDGRRSWHRLYEPGSGPAHSLISGDTRSGKSATASLLITQSVFTGFVVPFVGDPQGGASMPEWAGPEGRADWIAWNPDEIWMQTEAIIRLMHSRTSRLTRRAWVDEDGTTRKGFSYFDPDKITDLPIIDWTLDEAHHMLRDDSKYVQLVAGLVKQASKAGIRINLITQYPAAAPDLGGDMGLRQQLAAGNVVCHRNSSRTVSGMLLPDTMPSPFDIPKVGPTGAHTKGTNVSYSPAPLGDRPAYQRTALRKNAFKWADLAVEQIRRPIGTDDADALGDDYAKRWERFKARDSQPVTIPLAQARDAATPKPVPQSPRTKDRILAYLAEPDVNCRTSPIAVRLDLPIGTVGSALKSLAEAGQVVQVRRGVWALPATDDEAASA